MNRSTMRRGLRADELVHHLAVLECLHGRDALDAVRLREPGVAVHVDLDELDLARALSGGALERGGQRAARPAPLGPEVHHHGHLARAVDDGVLEFRLCDVGGHALKG